MALFLLFRDQSIATIDVLLNKGILELGEVYLEFPVTGCAHGLEER